MFIAAIMGKYGNNAQAHICWARSQMRIITGAETGKSYLIGWGPNQPQHPHHRQSACNIKYSEPCNPFNGGTCCAAESGTSVAARLSAALCVRVCGARTNSTHACHHACTPRHRPWRLL